MNAGAAPKILLIIGGGIAAYKALELVRLLRRGSFGVTAVLTQAGAQFVTPLSLQALTENTVFGDLFSLTSEHEMGHIELSRAADLVVVAPATADLLAKLAAGLAPDLASTILLATDKPVLVAPAMNVRMWQHPATVANMATLSARGVAVVGPNLGEMACHETGPGRMAEPAEIMAAIQAALMPAPNGPRLDGRHIVVTAGPTHEPIDPVRVIANRSSGQQGFGIARALAALGARVSLISGPVALPNPPGVHVARIETAQQMLAAVMAALPADAAVCAAAVADWGVEAAPAKLKKSAGPPVLRFIANPDILAAIAQNVPRPTLVVGFAAETDDVLANAAQKRIAKGCDWIVANDVSPHTGIMGGTRNQVHIFDAAGREDWPDLEKTEVARRLALRIAVALAQRTARTLA